MNTAFFISWNYQKTKQQNRLVALISKFATFGIAIGVMALIIVLSAMNGFERELQQRVLSVVPHLEIQGYNQTNNLATIADWRQLQNILIDNPEIVASAPYINFTALLENADKLKMVQVRGVDLVAQEQVSSINQFVLDNAWQQFQTTTEPSIILGRGIAEELGAEVGEWITILIAKTNPDMQFTQPERHQVKLAGILRLDGQLDHSYALVPLLQAQEYLAYTNNQVTGLEIKVNQPLQITNLNLSELANYPQSLVANSWVSKFGYMYNDIQMIRHIMYIAMFLVIGIASFSIVSTLVMAVKDKQGDIAIMRTLGANDLFIKKIFIYYGLISGMKGCLIGVILGILVALNLTDIFIGLEYILQTKILSDGIYFVDFLPSQLDWKEVIIVFIISLFLSLVASIYPASRAVKLQPATVLSSY